MVFILVFLTLAMFIAADWYMKRRRSAREAAAADLPVRRLASSASSPQVLSPCFVHPGHSWVRIERDGDASVGASEFASSFAGAVSTVELPSEGDMLRQGEPAWTLVSDRSRRLTQVMPVEGTVVAVNHRLARDPGLVSRGSKDDGWILRVRPTRLADNLRNLFEESLAEAWNQATRSRLTAAMGSELGQLANDGGVWVAGFGDMMDDDSWHALKGDLFPAIEEAPAPSAAQVRR